MTTQARSRSRRKRMTDKMVSDLKPGAKAYRVADPELAGHHIRVLQSGVRSYCAFARDPYARQVWHTIGRADLFSIEDAREAARSAIKRIKSGLPPIEPVPPQLQSFS